MPGKRLGPISEKQRAHLERLAQGRAQHGLCDHPLYSVWLGMKSRCLNPRNSAYANYGGRGIKVCQDWMDDFSAFFGWAMARGYERGLHIDRMDSDGDYEPGNCRFVTQAENNRNRRNTKLRPETILAVYQAHGSHADASRQFGIPYSIASKIRRGITYTNVTQGEKA